MNPSEFERTKPTETYHALQTMINKYTQIINEQSFDGRQLIMEGSDNAQLYIARQVVAELNQIKNLFLAGR